jgi:hypothetical protein
MSNTNEESSSRNIPAASTNKKSKVKNEVFYVKKRGLWRKADQIIKQCPSEIFIVIHHKENDKIYTYASDKNFTLQKVTELILRDLSTGSFLTKNKKFEDVDFEKTK